MSIEPLIFEMSSPLRRCVAVPEAEVPKRDAASLIPKALLRMAPPALPEVSELDLVRHFTHLSNRNIGVDTQLYPLGSCTMKYNPKVNEDAAALPGFTGMHPYQDDADAQGALELLHALEQWHCQIGGMDAACLQPSAGAQGELTALLVVRAYHQSKGRDPKIVLVPDSSHGTNPASAALCGYQVQTVKSDARGLVDMEDLKAHLSDDVACMMMTNPNTLGVFERDIQAIAQLVHGKGAQLYYDGANLNAICGVARPGDMGCDLMHFNVHKTFSTPHGGGGPGAGPIGVKAHLEPFLPVPRVVRQEDGRFALRSDKPLSIGRIRSYLGNFGVLVRAYAYLRAVGSDGLASVAQGAVLNANYLMASLAGAFEAPYGKPCMHEFVLSLKRQAKDKGVTALDYAKRLLDHGYHAPTVYFPLIVPEAVMIEPTETESRESLDRFAQTLLAIDAEASQDPMILKNAPVNTPVGRLDEASAARTPNLRWKPAQG
jgi:glycine dehydrogenase subunit 2